MPFAKETNVSIEMISIVIPSYNRASSLQRAIKSALMQARSDIEIIVVDDGSSDETSKVVDSLSEANNCIIYCRHENNRGAQAARNTGAKVARGEWISFLDSDDYFLPGSIEKKLDAACRASSKVVHTECSVIRDSNFQAFDVPPMQGNICREILSRPGPMFQGMLVHKDALERIGYLDENIISYQEWDTSIRLAMHYEFAFVAEPTFIYDCRGSDTISKDKFRDVNGYKQVVLKHREAILQYCGSGTMAEHCRQIANRYKALGLQKDYLEYLTKSLILRPSMSVGLIKRIVSKAKRFVLPDSARQN